MREANRSLSYWQDAWRRLRSDRIGMTFVLVLVLLAGISMLAPFISDHITRYSPSDQDLSSALQGPTSAHWLGTDELGRDTLTRLVWGGRVSLGVGALAVFLYVTAGTAVGTIAGYRGGRTDAVVMRFIDMVLAIPSIYLLILITTLLPLRVGPNIREPWFVVQHDAVSLSVVIASIAWVTVARLTRAEILSIKGREFVLAARSVGCGDARLMLQHLVPNALPVMIVTASLGFGQVILVEAALDFIGLGVRPPTPSWGNMLLNAQAYFYKSFLLVLLPGAVIVLAVLAANVVGNSLRDALDPRLRS